MRPEKPILSVTQLNRQIRSWLEQEVGNLYVEGEVSTLSQPASGHYYFTLKDAGAQVRCVFFRNRHATDTSTLLQTGQQIIVYGQLSLYEARGDYQLIVDSLENAGQGDLYRQFELLKIKLAALGLFDAARKKALPRFPETIGIVTSTNAAALRDILATLAKRYPIANILIYPSEVQGSTAHQQLINALQQANQDKRCDVLILARGGGSIEDLWAFNHEQLAHTIAESHIPIVSGIGHETDFTIADFVADYRAATPTAAAVAVSPHQFELMALLKAFHERLQLTMRRYVQHQQLLLQHHMKQLISPKQVIQSHWQTLDYLRLHLHTAWQKQHAHIQHQLQMVTIRLNTTHPAKPIREKQQHLQHLITHMIEQLKRQLYERQQRFETQLATLHAVSPLATLGRGYAIATYQNHVLLNHHDVAPGDVIQVKLAQGHLNCEVLPC